jgi:hypothetical protein
MSPATHAAIAAQAHAAMGCNDPLTDSLCDQATQPGALGYAEGQHPAQLQADADLALPWWAWEAAGILLVLVIGLSAALSNGVTS